MLGNHGYALANRMLHHREDAADAVQDAMHQMFRKSNSFDARRGSIKAWFLTIVRNRCIDMHRRSTPRSGDDDFDPMDEKGLPADHINQSNELVAQVTVALEAMSDSNREIILLRDFERLSYREISQILGIAPGTVMSRLHRARQQLKRDVMSGQKPETS